MKIHKKLVLSLFAGIAFVLSGCGSSGDRTQDQSNLAGPIDGNWTVNKGIPGNPSAFMNIEKEKGILKIYTSYATCVIALQYTLSYPGKDRVTIQSQISQAGDSPVGCAEKSAYSATPQQLAQNFQPQVDGTFSYVKNQNAAGTHLTLTSVKNSATVIEASK